MSNLLSLILIFTVYLGLHHVQAVPSPSFSLGTVRKWLSSRFYTSSASLAIEDRLSFLDMTAPPGFSSPGPSFFDTIELCESDCVLERMADCSECYINDASVGICKSYIQKLVDSGEDGPSTESIERFKNTVYTTATSTCAGMVLHLSDFEGLKLKVKNDDLSLLQLPPAEEIVAKAVAFFAFRNVEQELNTTIENYSAEIVNVRAARSTRSFPYNLKIEVITNKEIRKFVIRKAIRDLTKRKGFEDINANKFDVTSVKAIKNKQNKIVRYIVFIKFKDIETMDI